MGWAVLGVAVVVVLLTSVLKNVEWSSRVTNLIAAVLSVVGAVVTVLAANGWSVDSFTDGNVLEIALIVYGGSQLIYNFILKGTAVSEALDNVNVFGGNGNGE